MNRKDLEILFTYEKNKENHVSETEKIKILERLIFILGKDNYAK